MSEYEELPTEHPEPLIALLNKTIRLSVKVLAILMLPGSGDMSLAAAGPPSQPGRRVVAMYFHRTQRCPTCLRIGTYIEQAVKTGFPDRVKQGGVAVYLIDYQNAKNAKYTKAYKVTKPTLVIADVRDGKVTQWKPMPKVWSLVYKKDDFFKYVRDGVNRFLKEEKP